MAAHHARYQPDAGRTIRSGTKERQTMSAAGNTDTSNTTTTTTDTAAAAGTKVWFDGADAETVGHIQNRGLDKLPANEAALAAIKAHREAEKHLGVRADQI